MYKMLVTDVFVAFYIRKWIVHVNVAKIKRLPIKDHLQFVLLIPEQGMMQLSVSVPTYIGFKFSWRWQDICL